VSEGKLIYEKIVAVMADMEALGKSRENTQQGYKFRGIDDVYNMVQPIMAKHGLFMRSAILDERSEERATKSGSTLIYRVVRLRYYLVAADGSSVDTEVIGEGMDTGDKATNKAFSVAQKYALLQMFLIPTEEPKDPEVDSHEVKPTAKPVAAKKTEEPKTYPPITDAQIKEINESISYFKELTKKSDEEVWTPTLATLQKKFGASIKEAKDLTEPQAAWLIKALWSAIQKEGQKRADEIAAKIKGGAPAEAQVGPDPDGAVATGQATP